MLDTKFKLILALQVANSSHYLNLIKFKAKVLEEDIALSITILNRIIWELGSQIQLLRQLL